MSLVAPFPWCGGKRAVAAAVWERLGDVENYVEPFCGSAAVLLARPDSHRWWERIETINDADGFVANFWRALAADPLEVARWADWPVNENDLHARHAWLVGRCSELVERLEGDPEFYDAKVAGWWAWGASAWIGGGWCSGNGSWVIRDGRLVRGEGGVGVQRRLPVLNPAGHGVHATTRREGILAWFTALARRLRTVRVACGDWSRVVTPSVTVGLGVTGVFLDPPYPPEERSGGLYAVDGDVADAVRAWAVANGDDPRLRIALCGYEDAYEMPLGWSALRWTAHGGYGLQSREGRGRVNREREVVWFSPHCRPALQQPLFEEEM
ncbi:MAG: hypothetical protein KatS3mg014_2436 [Actinomycetota bacterium]|nr:MAG: hypothetical protein KatS3mg014_2436 [Actinomycetota bacterium]